MTMTIRFDYPIFEDYIAPQGFLPRDKGAHALFYFCMLAAKSDETAGTSVDSQRILEGEPWMDRHYDGIRSAVTVMYQLKSPDEMTPYLSAVRMQMNLLGLPEPKGEYLERRFFRKDS